MRNVTITLDDHVARWVRVLAARRETSVSRLVGEMLREQMTRDEAYEAAMEQYLALPPTVLKRDGRYPARDVLHDR